AAPNWLEAQRLEQREFNPLANDFYSRLSERADYHRLLAQLSFYTIGRHPIGYFQTGLQNLTGWFVDLIFSTYPYMGESLLVNYERSQPAFTEFQSTFSLGARQAFEMPREGFFLTRNSAYIPFFNPPSYMIAVIKVAFV